VRYFSPSLLTEFSGVTMRETVTIEGDRAAGTSSRAVWSQFSYAYDATHQMPYQSQAQRLAFDRRTGVVIGCCGAIVAGTGRRAVWAGQGYTWPAHARGVTYSVFDPVLLRPESARYRGQARIDGLTADTFVERPAPTRFAFQPLPGNLVGRKDQASVRLGEFYQTTTTYQVDPVTGQVVDINRNELLGLRSGGGRTALVLFSGDLRMQPGSVAALVRAARQRAVVVTAATVTVPGGSAWASIRPVPGRRAWSAAAAAGTIVPRADPKAASRTRSSRSPTCAASSASAESSRPMISAARSASSRPASVSCTLRPDRCSSWAPVSASSRAM